MTVPLVGAELPVAFSFRQFRGRGAAAAAASWTFLVSGALSASAYAVLTAVSAALTGTWWGVLLGAGGALAVTLAVWAVLVLLRRAAGRRRLLALGGSLLRRVARHRRGGKPVDAAHLQARVVSLGEQVGALRLPARAWAGVFGLALFNWAVDGLCLAASVAAVGAPIPWTGLLLAFLAAAGVSTLAITPGGLGAVELALTTALVAAGLGASHALAAALVYRLATLWLACGIGWLLYAALSSASSESRSRLARRVDKSGRGSIPRSDDSASARS